MTCIHVPNILIKGTSSPEVKWNLPLIYEIIWKPVFKIVALYTFQNWISALIVPNK